MRIFYYDEQEIFNKFVDIPLDSLLPSRSTGLRVGDIKNKLERDLGIPQDKQILLIRGQILHNDTRLEELSLNDGDSIEMEIAGKSAIKLNKPGTPLEQKDGTLEAAFLSM